MPTTGAFSTIWGLVVHPKTTWVALLSASRRHLWMPGLAILALTVALVLVFARANAGYIYRQQLAWYTARTASGGAAANGMPKPDVRPLSSQLLAQQTLREIGGLLLRWGVWGGLFLAAARWLREERVALADIVALILWGHLPTMLRGLQQVAFTLVTGIPIYNPGLSGLLIDTTPPPLTNLHYVAPTALQRSGAALLVGVDIFAFWQVTLLAWGFAALTGLPQRKAIRVAFIGWVLSLALNLVI